MLTIEKSLLLLVDMQGKMAGMMHEFDFLFAQVQKITRVSQILNIPVLYTEQAPDKIGQTVPEITWLLNNQKSFPKKSFSCWLCPEFVAALKQSQRTQIVVTGIESHVCIYQTVRDLLQAKYEVHVVADAVSSRTAANKQLGLSRSAQEGAVLTSFEMVACEWLQTAEHPHFREVLSLMK